MKTDLAAVQQHCMPSEVYQQESECRPLREFSTKLGKLCRNDTLSDDKYKQAACENHLMNATGFEWLSTLNSTRVVNVASAVNESQVCEHAQNARSLF